MIWPFRRRRDDMDLDTLLTKARAASPTSAASMAGSLDGASGTFRMTVEDVFAITGRGLVATGRVEAGTVSKGTAVRVLRAGQEVAVAEVTGVEMFRKVLDSATVGDHVGLLLKGLTRDDVSRGDVLTG